MMTTYEMELYVKAYYAERLQESETTHMLRQAKQMHAQRILRNLVHAMKKLVSS